VKKHPKTSSDRQIIVLCKKLGVAESNDDVGTFRGISEIAVSLHVYSTNLAQNTDKFSPTSDRSHSKKIC